MCDEAADGCCPAQTLVNHFILRRTNELLQKHLPPKTVQVVCCKLTPLQQKLYQTICQSKDIVRIYKTGKGTKMVNRIVR